MAYKAVNPSSKISVSCAGSSEQRTFALQQLDRNVIQHIEKLLLLPVLLWRGDVYKLKNAVMYDFTYTPKDNIMMWGPNDEFWYSEILYLFAYDVAGKVNKVFAKVQWYQTLQSSFNSIVTNRRQTLVVDSVKQNSMQQFDIIVATKLETTDVIDLSTAYRPVLVMPLSTIANEASQEMYVIDCCYFINKMYEIA